MVSGKVTGGLLLGASAVFGGVLLTTIKSLSQQSAVLGCVAATPGCMEVASGLSASHVAVGFVSAIVSMGLYFVLFHKEPSSDVSASLARSREEQAALLARVLTEGEKKILDIILAEEGVLQATLAYRVDLTPGRISQVVSHFEEQGLVSRKPEGRSYRIFPSF